MDELHKKGIEKALEAIKRFTEDPDPIDLDWDAEIRQLEERQARRQGELPGQPTAVLLQFPQSQEPA